jgi:hypothetical protein
MRKSALAMSGTLLFFSTLGIFAPQKTLSSEAVQDFEIEGTGLFMCQCPGYACPCQTNGRPTLGTCYAADFAHIRKGHYGKMPLDGLNVVMVGNLVDMNAGRLHATLYLDEKGSPAQRDAMQAMVEYMNAEYVALAGEAPVPINKVKSARIQFHGSADNTLYTVDLPGILQEKAVLKRDPSGKPISTLAAMDMWSNTVHYADNVEFKYHDKELGKSWDYSGRQANLKFFHLSKQMYQNREMLGQHGDMSGKWTPKQNAIIQKAGLN